MLSFVDLPKGIRIIRIETKDDSVVRTTLGRISKSTLEIDTVLREQLGPKELIEVEEIVAGYVESQLIETRSYAMNLPVIIRRVMEYLEQDASDIERRFISSALVEGIRRVRKLEREAHP